MSPAHALFTIPCRECLAEVPPHPSGLCDDCELLPVPTPPYRDRFDLAVETPRGPGVVLTLARTNERTQP